MVPDDVVYGFGRIDESGRVADRAMTSALGWRAGDRLTLTAEAGVIIARRDPVGMVTMPAKPYLVIPAALRRRCGLRAGDRVLLAVFPARNMLAAYSFAVVDQALRAHAAVPAAKGGSRDRRQPGGLPAGCGGGGAAAAGADGPVPGGPGRRPAVPAAGADVRRVRPGGVGGGQRRDPPGVRLVLEPGPGALGRPAAGRADAVGDPAADGLRQDPRGGPPQRPRRAQRRRSTWWPRCAACTSAPWRTG